MARARPGKPASPDEPALTTSLAENRTQMQIHLGGVADIAWRALQLPAADGVCPALLVYARTMLDPWRLERVVLGPLLEGGTQLLGAGALAQARLPASQVRWVAGVTEAVRGVARGEVALLVEGRPGALLVDVADPPAREVADATIEPAVHGSREGFNTELETSLGQLRRRLPTPQLRFEELEVGQITRTTVVIAYLADRARPALVAQVRARLQRLRLSALIDTEDLRSAISDRPGSLFPTVHVTERPDLVARSLVSGHVAVLANNSPKALILPGLLYDLLTATDDFYDARPFVVVVRLARMLALIISIFLPAVYISITTFHLQALPTLLTLSLLAQREGAPLPTPVEAAVMVLMFEILREAGLRLPRPVGPSVSIVGGLVIGEAAMRAGVTSPAMVLVVSATAISTFALPSTNLANVATVLRLALLVIASVLGFFGLMIGYVVGVAYLAGLTSGGVPYAAPTMPLQPDLLPEAYGFKPLAPKSSGPWVDPNLTRLPRRADRGRP